MSSTSNDKETLCLESDSHMTQTPPISNKSEKGKMAGSMFSDCIFQVHIRQQGHIVPGSLTLQIVLDVL